MKLINHLPDFTYALTGHGRGFVLLNGERVETSLVVCAEAVDRQWAADFSSLTQDHFRRLLDFQPELVLFGSGQQFRFPAPQVVAPLIEAGIGFETMDTQAACRTYAVLASEGRRVVAALLIP